MFSHAYDACASARAWHASSSGASLQACRLPVPAPSATAVTSGTPAWQSAHIVQLFIVFFFCLARRRAAERGAAAADVTLEDDLAGPDIEQATVDAYLNVDDEGAGADDVADAAADDEPANSNVTADDDTTNAEANPYDCNEAFCIPFPMLALAAPWLAGGRGCFCARFFFPHARCCTKDARGSTAGVATPACLQHPR